MLQMTTTMGMATTTTMSTGVATTVTVMATSTTAAPLQLLLPLLPAVTLQLQLQLLLARGTFLAKVTLTTATTTTMTPALHQLQPLPAVVMLLLLPQLHLQVLLHSHQCIMPCPAYCTDDVVRSVLCRQCRCFTQKGTNWSCLHCSHCAKSHFLNAVTAIVCQCLPADKLMCALQADMMATLNIQLLLLLLLHQAQVHCRCLVQCWHQSSTRVTDSSYVDTPGAVS